MKVALLLILLQGVCGDPIVKTGLGLIRGVETSLGSSFMGIPFAEPPLKNLRWSPPVPISAWSGVFNATSFSPGCSQICLLPPNTCPETVSEDCLYLNVFVPPTVNLTSTPQPVMLFLHGGRFEQGAAGTILYDGSFMANRSGVIIVTTNYRLGALGWLAVNQTYSGNYGFMDQRLALQWVVDNIAAFGGDPTQITLFGQSAGATSTTGHIISSFSKGLFQRAIIESDPFTLPMKPLADAMALAARFVEDSPCNTSNDIIECLRGISADDIVAAQTESQKWFNFLKPLETFLPWTPTIDGNIFTEQSLNAFSSGNYIHGINIIIGTVSQECIIFIYTADQSKLTDADYITFVTDVFTTDVADVLVEYPPEPFIGDKRPLLSQLGTDYIFTAPTRNAAQNIVNSTDSQQDLYLYQFSHSPGQDFWGPSFPFCVGHVCHGSELPFVFHPDGYYFSNYTGEYNLSLSMVDYWTNFARSGNPNVGTNTPFLVWPKYDDVNRYFMNFSVPNSVEQNLEEFVCDFWDSIGYDDGWN